MDKITSALALLGLFTVAGLAGVMTEPALGEDGSNFATLAFVVVGVVLWLRALKRR